MVHSDDDLGWKVKPEHGKVAEIDKALEEEDNVDEDDKDEENEEGLVVAEVAHVEVLGQLVLKFLPPAFWSRWTGRNQPFTWTFILSLNNDCLDLQDFIYNRSCLSLTAGRNVRKKGEGSKYDGIY